MESFLIRRARDLELSARRKFPGRKVSVVTEPANCRITITVVLCDSRCAVITYTYTEQKLCDARIEVLHR